MDQVSIPPLITHQRPPDYDECEDFNPVLHIRTLTFAATFKLIKTSHHMFHWSNENPITLLSNTSKTIEFPVLFITSLPALCILTVDSVLHRYGLSHMTNSVTTNDTYPSILLFNYTKKTIILHPYHLTVYCQIVLNGKSLNKFLHL